MERRRHEDTGANEKRWKWASPQPVCVSWSPAPNPPAHTFPNTGAVWNAAQAAVETTSRHHEATIKVKGVPVPRTPRWHPLQ